MPPSIQTLIADLQNFAGGGIVGIGMAPPSHSSNLDKPISETCRVKYNFVHANATISGGGRLTFADAGSSPIFNASYLHYQDDWSTVANMDVNRRIVGSGNFSGCMWKVFRSDQAGLYKCVHIARPGGGGTDALVSLITQGYAPQGKWTEVQSISTAGHVNVGNCTQVFVVSQLSTNSIDTVVLDLDRQNQTIAAALHSVAV